MPRIRSVRRARIPRPLRERKLSRLLERIANDLGRSLNDLLIVVLVDDDSQIPSGAGPFTLVPVHGNIAGAAAAMRHQPSPDLILEMCAQVDRLKLFRAVFWSLADGGRYVAVDAGTPWSDALESVLRSAESGSVAASRRRTELIESVDRRSSAGRTSTVVKRGEHHGILRHSDVEETLAARYGDEWGQVLARRDAYQYNSRAEVIMHGEPSKTEWPRAIDVPDLSVREYRDVTCHMREIITRDNLILPDSYRHWQRKNLFHRRVHPASEFFGRLAEETRRGESRTESGTFYSLDSAFPAHFGHLMTETISRYWGWRHAVRSSPGIRPIMTHQEGKPRLPAWKSDVLRALGIRVEDILFVPSGESVRVDRLIAAMPQLANPNYIDLGIRQTWDEIASGVGPDPSAHGRPEKIFLSRRRQTQRTCSNTAEVENFFESQGFTILLPEELGFAEQVHIFARAKVIAGFAGSALFNAMFNSTAKILVLSSQSYVAANEYLIASVNGNELHYFWAPPLIEQPEVGFSVDAYRSGFEFPIEEHRSGLLSVIEG